MLTTFSVSLCFPFLSSPFFFSTLEDPKKQGLPLWIEEEIQGLLRNSRWEILRQVCCVNFLSSILSRFCLIYLKLHALSRGGDCMLHTKIFQCYTTIGHLMCSSYVLLTGQGSV